MTEVLSVIAFLMAFGAVLLANDAVRKVEQRNEAFIKGQVDKLSQAMVKDLDKLQIELIDLDRSIKPQARTRPRATA